MTLQLLIGNKNYSSWSMRPWVLMRELGIAFTERRLRFDFTPGSAFYREMAAVSPAGKVPVLIEDGFAVWDTLAIAEYLHERAPQAGVWPAEARARARARSIAAEMHSGFPALRQHCPMNIEAHLPEVGRQVMAEQPGVVRDLARIEQMWQEALASSGGPMLFGRFSAADAFYAPVCMRIRGYALPVSAPVQAYIDRVVALASVQAWIADALAEADFVPEDEPYRQSR